MARSPIAVCGVVLMFSCVVCAYPRAQDAERAVGDRDPADAARLGACISGPGLGLRLRVSLAVSSSLAEPFVEGIRREVAAVWQQHGVALLWADASELRSHDDSVLRLIVQDAEMPSTDVGVAFHVGWIRFISGRPQNIVRVSTRAALAYVNRHVAHQAGRQYPLERLLIIDRYRDVFGRLLAWSLAHEIGHYALGTRTHRGAGLMRAAFVPQDLLDGRVTAVSLVRADALWLGVQAGRCAQAGIAPPG